MEGMRSVRTRNINIIKIIHNIKIIINKYKNGNPVVVYNIVSPHYSPPRGRKAYSLFLDRLGMGSVAVVGRWVIS
jgi:hypothetical protein